MNRLYPAYRAVAEKEYMDVREEKQGKLKLNKNNDKVNACLVIQAGEQGRYL